MTDAEYSDRLFTQHVPSSSRPSNEKDRPFNIQRPDGALQKEILCFDGEPWATNKDWPKNAKTRFLDWEE